LLDLVRQAPGIHLREAQRRAGLGIGATVYNLRKLVSLGLVTRLKQGKFVRYYDHDTPSMDTAILNALRLSSQRRILLALLTSPDLTARGLAIGMKLSKSTVTWHLKKLESAGLIKANRDSKPTSYRLLDSTKVSQLVLRFMPTTIDELADRFLNSWDAL
jgi:predicted transcriptional regulator